MLNKQNGQRVWFITGTAKGFGKELVKGALDLGDSVIATSRTPEKVAAEFAHHGKRLLALPMDLHNISSIESTVKKGIDRFGTIDILVNNAGYGLLGAIEEASDEEILEQFEINVFALMRLTRAVLPILRKQRSGHIVNFSSIAGLVGWGSAGIYSATKFAVEGISESLAMEVAPLGIGMTIVEPGPFRTDFLGDGLKKVKKEISDYEETAGVARSQLMALHKQQEGDPVRGALAIIEAILSDKPPLHLILGEMAYQRAQQKLKELEVELSKWSKLSHSVDFPKHLAK